jgi:membrane protein implicated in regulation of membrane protease activity
MRIFNIMIASGLSMFSILLFFPLNASQKEVGYNWTYPFYWNLAVLLCMFIAIIMVLFYRKQQKEMEKTQVLIEMQKAEMQYLLLKHEKKQR